MPHQAEQDSTSSYRVSTAARLLGETVTTCASTFGIEGDERSPILAFLAATCSLDEQASCLRQMAWRVHLSLQLLVQNMCFSADTTPRTGCLNIQE